MRISIVQFGVFHHKFADLRAGGAETYYAQRYSVEFVANLARRCEFLGVCGVLGDKVEEVAVEGALHSACIPLIGGSVDAAAVINLLARWRPDRLIVQSPVRPILKWALARKIDTFPLFADSWEEKSLRGKLRGFLLARQLKNPAFRAVGNHNLPAALSLKRIGAPAEKIYPWDWPHDLRPENHAPKTLASGTRPHLVFVGGMVPTKGPNDCIEAARILREAGRDFEMTLIGGGELVEPARAEIARLGLADRVHIAGRVDHDEAVARVATATLSIVPSHHAYPEGLPMTIYEALATRTPLVLSDHPMFQFYFAKAQSVRMVPEKNPRAIAEAIGAWLDDPDAYAVASLATEDLWRRIKCDLTWGDLIEAWLDQTGAGLAKVRHHALDRRLAALA